MAISQASYAQTEAYAAFLPETTFGTAVADSGNFVLLEPFDQNAPSFNPTFFRDDAIKGSGKNMVDVSDVFQTANGQIHTLAMGELIGRQDIVAKLMYGVAQNVSEAVGAPYVKTYTFDGTNKPNFSANAGYFQTLLIKNGSTGAFSDKLTSCLVNQLTVAIDPIAQGGRMRVTPNWTVGKGYARNANPSGTNAASTLDAVNWFDSTAAATFSINSVDCVCNSISFVFTTNYSVLGYASNGTPNNFGVTRQAITANVNVKYDDNSRSFPALEGTTTGATIFNIGANSAAGYFKFNGDDTFVQTTSFNRGNQDTAQSIDLTLQFLVDSANTQAPTVEIADGVDQAW